MPKTTARRSIAKKKTNCDQCKYEIKEELEDYIQCDKCGKNYHSQCTKLSRREFERLLKNESEMYTCHCCDEGGDLRNELKTIKTELKKLEKLEKLDQLTESITYMSAKFDEVFKDVQENKSKIKEIEKENKKLKNEIKTLKESVKYLNNDRVKNDCVISGLTLDDNVKPIDAVVDLSKKVGLEINTNAIDDVYFVGNKKQSNEKRTIVVKFASKLHKDKLMSAKPNLKENVLTKTVYVNDFHSKETLNLLYYAKSLKSIGYQHVYARNGKVFCKKSNISRQLFIKCEDDVDKMLLEATTNKHWQRRSTVQNRELEVESDDDGEDGATFVSP